MSEEGLEVSIHLRARAQQMVDPGHLDFFFPGSIPTASFFSSIYLYCSYSVFVRKRFSDHSKNLPGDLAPRILLLLFLLHPERKGPGLESRQTVGLPQ